MLNLSEYWFVVVDLKKKPHTILHAEQNTSLIPRNSEAKKKF